MYMYMYIFTCMPHTMQTDFANRDARAAFFSRVDGGDMVGPPRSFPGPGTCTCTCTLYIHVY